MQSALKVFGKEHPHSLTSMNNLAHTYHGLNRVQEAIELMAETAGLRNKILGPNHHDTIKSTENLDKWLKEVMVKAKESGKPPYLSSYDIMKTSER